MWQFGAIIALLLNSQINSSPNRTMNNKNSESVISFEQLVSDGRTADSYRALLSEFPTEFYQLKRSVQDIVNKGGNAQDITAFSANWWRNFDARYSASVAQAPAAKMSELQATQIKLIMAERDESAYSCAAAVMGNYTAINRSDETVRLAHERRAKMIEAAALGLQHPANRKVETLEQADADAITAAVKLAGSSQDDIDFFYQGMKGGSVERQCKVGLSFLLAISKLPLEQSARITGFLMS